MRWVFGVESLSVCMKNEMTQNQQTNFVVKFKAVFVIILFRNKIGGKGKVCRTFSSSRFSATKNIFRVILVYIVYSRIIPPGIGDRSLSDF